MCDTYMYYVFVTVYYFSFVKVGEAGVKTVSWPSQQVNPEAFSKIVKSIG